MKILMKNMEANVRGRAPMMERHDLIKNWDYFVSCFVVLLRGGEGFMMYAEGLQNNIRKRREVPLNSVVGEV